MATKVLSGGIDDHVRILEQADLPPIVFLDSGYPKLSVIEHGDTRLLPISIAVAEVLIANGTAYGS